MDTDKKFLIKEIIMFILFIIILIIIFSLLNSFTTFIKINFDIYLILKLLLALILVLGFWFVFSEVVLKHYYKFRNNWRIWTLGLMILFLILGGVWIEHMYGQNNELKLVLRNSTQTTQIVGNISCSDSSHKLLVDSLIYCDIYPKLEFYNAKYEYKLSNGKEFQENFSNLSFIPVNDIEYIKFYISGKDEKNISYNLEVGYPFKFYTEDQEKERADKYISYYIILFGAVLFSIPAMMQNFYSMRLEKIENKKKKNDKKIRK